MAKGRGSGRKQPTREQAVNLLTAVRRKRIDVQADCRRIRAQHIADALAGDGSASRKHLRDRIEVLRKLDEGEEKLKAMLGEDAKIVVEKRQVEDPQMSHAQIVEERRKWPDAHNIGRIAVGSNLVTLVGGFARFDHKTDAEIEAASRLRKLSEQAEIAAARATDYASPLVDTSWSGDAEKVMLSGEDARRELDALRRAIGGDMIDLLTAIIVRDISVRTIAGPGASGGRIRMWRARVRAGLDQCGVHWNLKGSGQASKRVRSWRDGSRATYAVDQMVEPSR